MKLPLSFRRYGKIVERDFLDGAASFLGETRKHGYRARVMRGHKRRGVEDASHVEPHTIRLLMPSGEVVEAVLVEEAGNAHAGSIYRRVRTSHAAEQTIASEVAADALDGGRWRVKRATETDAD